MSQAHFLSLNSADMTLILSGSTPSQWEDAVLLQALFEECHFNVRLCWRRVKLLLFQTSWSRKELTACTRPLISAEVVLNVSLLTFSSSWYSKEITLVSKKLTRRYSWYVLALQLYIAGTLIIWQLWFYLLDSLMYVLKTFWEQVLRITNPTFWPPWCGSFALVNGVLCPYSLGLGSD